MCVRCPKITSSRIAILHQGLVRSPIKTEGGVNVLPHLLDPTPMPVLTHLLTRHLHEHYLATETPISK